MDKIITVLGYKIFITEMSYAPDCFLLFHNIFIILYANGY